MKGRIANALTSEPFRSSAANAGQANGNQEMNSPYFDSNSEKIPDEEYLENQSYRSLKAAPERAVHPPLASGRNRLSPNGDMV